MIVVRDIFHLKFGKAKEFREALGEWKKLIEKFGHKKGRFLCDLISERSYTFIMEHEWDDLTNYEQTLKEAFKDPEWGQLYTSKIVPLVHDAKREILSVVEV
jgi:hypothetical protein